MLDPPDLEGMLARLRVTDQTRELGEALLDQRLVAGIGNKWRAEGLFLAQVSPWARLRAVDDASLRRVLAETAAAMQGRRRGRLVYDRAGLPCPRCATRIAAWRQGDDARTAFWCPTCQPSPAGSRIVPTGST
jgi:endonuclease-8